MKIAQIAPLIESVPPRLYGGTERIVSYLTEELVRLGHDVTLFASGDSITAARLVPCAPTALRLDPHVRDPIPYYMLMLDRVRERADDFDILHFHIDQFHFPLFRPHAGRTLTTLAWTAGPARSAAALFRLQRDAAGLDLRRAARADRRTPTSRPRSITACPSTCIARHSTRAAAIWPFLAAYRRRKRVDRAIEIARALGMPLKIAAKVDRVDEAYFREQIAPLLDDAGRRIHRRNRRAGKDRLPWPGLALLFPIDWPEPFGLVDDRSDGLRHAGPRIPPRFGPEVVEHGVSGCIVDSLEEAVLAVPQVVTLDRRAVRRQFETRFSGARMAKDYVRRV